MQLDIEKLQLCTFIVVRGCAQTTWTAREGGGLKISEKCPRYRCKLVHVGGRGGQKCPKIGPHGLSMAPILICKLVTMTSFVFILQ